MLNKHDAEYNKLVEYILENGVRKPNRTGIDTIGVFAYQMRFDLRDGTIPLLTTKKMHTRSIIHEILWYLKGDGNIQYLKDNNVTIWDEWADENGNLGPVYGVQWRKWPTYQPRGDQARYVFNDQDATRDNWYVEGTPIDQITNVINALRYNPWDRRMIVSAWNVAEISNMALPPCHYTFQFYTRPMSYEERLELFGRKYDMNDLFWEMSQTGETIEQVLDSIDFPTYELSLMLNQRSCDVGLGVPFNVVQYSILLRMFCEVANMLPGEFIWSGADVHVYENHIDALKEQITRTPYPSPTFKFGRVVNHIDDFTFDDFVIENYESHPTIKMDVAV
jgi:thymidylate synthase